MSERVAEVLARRLYEMNGSAWYGRDLGGWDDPNSRIGRNEFERSRWIRQAEALEPLIAERERAAAERAWDAGWESAWRSAQDLPSDDNPYRPEVDA